MLSQAQRTTILELNTQGVSKREIARVLGISRVAVRKVLRSNSTALPELHRIVRTHVPSVPEPGVYIFPFIGSTLNPNSSECTRKVPFCTDRTIGQIPHSRN